MSESQTLVARQQEPFNAGPSLRRLCQSTITPNELFYVRSHGNTPAVDPVSFRLTVDGSVNRPLSLSLDEIRNQFPRVQLAATLQCAGNRRQELMSIRPIPGEVAWGPEAIGNAMWTGTPLRAILAASGVVSDRSGALHVGFLGLDRPHPEGQPIPFGNSILLDQAIRPEVVLAYEMNGEPLAPAHGFPLRLVVPGYIGARSVKWLANITVQSAPSDNYYRRHAYKLFPPQTRAENVDWDTGLVLGETPVNAAICEPEDGSMLPAGMVQIRGYAVTGGDRQVERVDVSTDGGKTWREADWLDQAQPGSWRLWQVGAMLEPGAHTLVVRALDSAVNSQPEALESVWNFKGYMNNAWHRVKVRVSTA